MKLHHFGITGPLNNWLRSTQNSTNCLWWCFISTPGSNFRRPSRNGPRTPFVFTLCWWTSSEIFGGLRTSSTVLLGALCQAFGQWQQAKKARTRQKASERKTVEKEERRTCKNLLKYLTTHFQQVCVSRKTVCRVKMSNLKMCRVWTFHTRSPCFIECSRETNVIDVSVDIQWGIEKQC